jgi:hypothetical protein
MGIDDIEKMLDEMYEHFGTLPSPEHEPKRFKHYVKLFKYYRSRNNGNQTE